MKITGSKPFEINALDWHSLERRFLVLLASFAVIELPQFIDQNISYVFHLQGHSYNLTAFVFLVVTAVIHFLTRYVADNSNVTVSISGKSEI